MTHKTAPASAKSEETQSILPTQFSPSFLSSISHFIQSSYTQCHCHCYATFLNLTCRLIVSPSTLSFSFSSCLEDWLIVIIVIKIVMFLSAFTSPVLTLCKNYYTELLVYIAVVQGTEHHFILIIISSFFSLQPLLSFSLFSSSKKTTQNGISLQTIIIEQQFYL